MDVVWTQFTKLSEFVGNTAKRKSLLTSRQRRISISTFVGSACPLGSVVNRTFQTFEVVHTLRESRTQRKRNQKQTVILDKNAPKTSLIKA